MTAYLTANIGNVISILGAVVSVAGALSSYLSYREVEDSAIIIF